MSDNALVGFIHRTERYEEDFMKYGYSPLSLTMPSDRRNIRYYELTKSFLLEKEMPFVLCDAGCGFGDVNGYLHEIGVSDYRYIGLDVVDSFLAEGEKRYGSDTIKYYKKDFTRDDLSEFSWDFAISSQTFNALYSTQEENYAMMFSSISRLFERCSERGGYPLIS